MPAFFGLYRDEARYLVLMGGAGSGKSIFAGRKILERVSSEAGHRVLVVRKVARTLRESCFAQLTGQVNEHFRPGDFRVNRTELSLTHRNGSRIIFAGLDDNEKLKSIYNITMIWVEEASEILEADFNQLDIRLRGETPYYKQIILTFNPVDVRHWLKKRFFDSTVKGASVHRSTYRDNMFLDEAAKKVLEGYKETDSYYYTVYCLGEWGVYGRSVFAADKLSQRLAQLPAAVRGGFCYAYDGRRITEAHFAENGGEVAVYEMPQRNTPYVIGADTAGDGSDRAAAQVINNLTGAQAAVFICERDEDVFTRELYCLGMWYNGALIGVEANFSSYPIKELERLGYPHQYVRETEDSFSGRVKNSYGFRTTAVTRPVIISELIGCVREQPYLLNDRTTVEEMLTFVRNEKGRPEAAAGCHDDTVMALAIAYYIRPQQLYDFGEETESPVYNFRGEQPPPEVLGRGEEMTVL